MHFVVVAFLEIRFNVEIENKSCAKGAFIYTRPLYQLKKITRLRRRRVGSEKEKRIKIENQLNGLRVEFGVCLQRRKL